MYLTLPSPMRHLAFHLGLLQTPPLLAQLQAADSANGPS